MQQAAIFQLRPAGFAPPLVGTSTKSPASTLPTTLDPANRNTNNAQLSGGNLIVTGVNQGAPQCVRTTNQVTVGSKLYFEVEITVLASGGHVTLGASDDSFVFATTFDTPGHIAGSKGAGLHDNDSIYPSVTNDGYSQVQGGILQCCIKRTSSTAIRLWIGHNNTWVGDPSAETGGETVTLSTPSCYGYVGVNRVDSATARFTAASQSFAAPTGAMAWDAAPVTTITTIAVGLSTEADSGLALALGLGLGLSSETDAALPLSAVLVRATGISTESDLSLGLGLARGVGLSSESDSALALIGVQIRTAGLASETDTALALAGVLVRAAGLATETDAALGLGLARSIGVAAETDSTLALAAKLIAPVGLSSETDTAFALAAGRFAAAVGLSTEGDIAQALSALLRAPVGVSTELDLALALERAQGHLQYPLAGIPQPRPNESSSETYPLTTDQTRPLTATQHRPNEDNPQHYPLENVA